ncbi:histidinol phosphatase, partial [Helicobacter pylori]|uniref:histidinol phosphatase n=1 Tax=Helicobacter pylori TaxID=210 RepID=UPI00214B5BC9
NDFNTSMKANEQEVTNTLNANINNIRNEFKRIENEIIKTTTRLLTSYQIFLNNAIESATTQINASKTQSLEEIKNAKESALNNITQQKSQATSEINEAKKTAMFTLKFGESLTIEHDCKNLMEIIIQTIRAVKPFILNSHNPRNEDR